MIAEHRPWSPTRGVDCALNDYIFAIYHARQYTSERIVMSGNVGRESQLIMFTSASFVVSFRSKIVEICPIDRHIAQFARACFLTNSCIGGNITLLTSSCNKTTRVTSSEIVFLVGQRSRVADLYFIIRLSTIVNPSASYINCHPQLCHLHSTLQPVKEDFTCQSFPLSWKLTPTIRTNFLWLENNFPSHSQIAILFSITPKLPATLVFLSWELC